MASRRRTLPDSSTTNGFGQTSASASGSVVPPLFLDPNEVKIKEEEDELFGQSDLSEPEPELDGEQDQDLDQELDEDKDQLQQDGDQPLSTNTSTRGVASRRPGIKPRTKKSAAKAQFKLGPHLDAPRSLTLSCDILKKRVEAGTVDINPEYQRDTVWTYDKQSALIDSIFRRYYVPPILFSRVEMAPPGEEGIAETDTSIRRTFNPTIKAVKTSKKSSGNKRKRRANDDDDDFNDEDEEDDEDEDDEAQGMTDNYVCIDGKQRLSSIINFMNNHIPIIDPKTKAKFWFNDDPIARKRGISSKLRKVFEDSQISVVEYSSLSRASEREMFSRVQLGVTLSPAEKLRAQPGEWGSFFRRMASKYLRAQDGNGKPSLGSIVDIKRGGDYRSVLQLGLLIIKKEEPNFTPTTTELQRWAFSDEAKSTKLDPKKAKQIEDTLIHFTELLQKRDKGVLPEAVTGGLSHRKNLAPIEWVYVAVFLWAVGPKLKRHPDVLTESLVRLRAHVRNKHPDVMWKPAIAKDYREFIKTERQRLYDLGYLEKKEKSDGEKKKRRG